MEAPAFAGAALHILPRAPPNDTDSDNDGSQTGRRAAVPENRGASIRAAATSVPPGPPPCPARSHPEQASAPSTARARFSFGTPPEIAAPAEAGASTPGRAFRPRPDESRAVSHPGRARRYSLITCQAPPMPSPAMSPLALSPAKK